MGWLLSEGLREAKADEFAVPDEVATELVGDACAEEESRVGGLFERTTGVEPRLRAADGDEDEVEFPYA
ncbi:hypothetical protein HK101_003629, partial [Irineochytrium annulatum]